jgi:oligopeptide transport system ATP-binding protein
MREGDGMSEVLVEARGLRKHFPVSRHRAVRAVDGVALAIRRGETLGLVGESGCGKTTLARLLLNLVPPTAGEIHFEGRRFDTLRGGALRALRRRMQIVFQDPYSSLNPRMTVGRILSFPMAVHGLHRARRAQRVAELLRLVGLASTDANRYPHEFSGGQLQRVGIARALAVEPDFVVCDEAVSALDVSIQAQILNLFADLQRQLGLTYLFVGHDLSVVQHVSDRIAVMYLGKVVELAPAERLHAGPLHPYTQSLIAAVPLPDPEIERSKPRFTLVGEVPSPLEPPSGCRFHTRCPHVMPTCRTSEPVLQSVVDDHAVACHLHADSRETPDDPAR